MAICLNQRYDGDRDPADGVLPNGAKVPFLEIGLKSSCTNRWFGTDFIHVVTNYSGFESYDVVWASPVPGIAAIATPPGGVVTSKSASLKSCIQQDKGVTNTRVAPRAAAPVVYAVAPACIPGWVLLDELKDLFGMVRDEMDDSPENVISLAASLSFSTLSNPAPYRSFQIVSQLELVKASVSTQYLYRFAITNHSESELEFHIDSMRNDEFPEGFAGKLAPGQSVDTEFAMDVDTANSEPMENYGTAFLFDGCRSYQLGVSAILPKAWVPGMVELPPCKPC